MTHTSACWTHALINALENMRDSDTLTKEQYLSHVANGVPLLWARMYLESGTVTCMCK